MRNFLGNFTEAGTTSALEEPKVPSTRRRRTEVIGTLQTGWRSVIPLGNDTALLHISSNPNQRAATVSPSSNEKSSFKRLIVLAAVVGVAIAVFAIARSRPASKDPAASASRGSGTPKTPTVADGACVPSHCTSAECETCTAQNCVYKTDGCDHLGTPAERKMCEEVYACFNDPANKCVVQGDALKCWCGTNPVTCISSNEPPTQANGPCREKVFEATATRDAATVWSRLTDQAYPSAGAVNLTFCRGQYCKTECNIP